jgi:hypothetical protein
MTGKGRGIYSETREGGCTEQSVSEGIARVCLLYGKGTKDEPSSSSRGSLGAILSCGIPTIIRIGALEGGRIQPLPPTSVSSVFVILLIGGYRTKLACMQKCESRFGAADLSWQVGEN